MNARPSRRTARLCGIATLALLVASCAPAPVAPAMRMCGIFARSAITARPLMSRPMATSSGLVAALASGEAVVTFREKPPRPSKSGGAGSGGAAPAAAPLMPATEATPARRLLNSPPREDEILFPALAA